MPEDKIAQIKRSLEEEKAKLDALKTRPWLSHSDWEIGVRLGEKSILGEVIEELKAILESNQEPPPLPSQQPLLERIIDLERRMLEFEEHCAATRHPVN